MGRGGGDSGDSEPMGDDTFCYESMIKMLPFYLPPFPISSICQKVCTRAKSGIPYPSGFLCSVPACIWHDSERLQSQKQKTEREDRKTDRDAGSLPFPPCSELMKQEKLGYTSNINLHTHTRTAGAITQARKVSRHIEHVCRIYLNILPPSAQTKNPNKADSHQPV